jgi:hypothetical protein
MSRKIGTALSSRPVNGDRTSRAGVLKTIYLNSR